MEILSKSWLNEYIGNPSMVLVNPVLQINSLPNLRPEKNKIENWKISF